jgi:prevent-host-death family protein
MRREAADIANHPRNTHSGQTDQNGCFSMRRVSKSKAQASSERPGRWALQDAKARFSKLVRMARSEGPQLVTVHGRDEVVVISAEEFRHLKGGASGQALIDVLQASPHRGLEIDSKRMAMPVRDVVL